MEAPTSPLPPADDAAAWPLLLGLQQRCMRARDNAELGFVIANETWHLLPYAQAAVFHIDRLGAPALKTVSGLATLAEETPFTLWLGRVCRVCRLASAEFTDTAPQLFDASKLPPDLAEGWSEWWPEYAVLAPLAAPSGARLGLVMLVRNTPWQAHELQLLGLLAETWGYCSHALDDRRRSLAERWQALRRHPRQRWLWLALAASLLIPVRLSALAPAEIIPLQAQAVAAPMEGVVKTFHVPPNASVKQGQALFALDDTTLRNRREVAQKALAVARADALAAQQKAFDSLQSKGDLAALYGRVKEKEAELAYLDEALTRIEVTAAHDGVLVYGDPNDWLGKPVVTGERIAQLAEPGDLGVLMWLAVGDAINLEAGAAMRVYLQVTPLSSIEAELVQTSYQAMLSPEGIAAYRIRGRLAPGAEARIGLRGVAKVYGAWQPLIYWMLRRPLGALRQWVGL